ncbi:hypothetical protein GL213_00040 [Halogeometricum borinquense]|uniref:Uncharacterized protein n=2 Tax=Halogeometricum borinquense TaxID=60847 RepID=E4NQZ5_HALBP|nr:hypothetical protein [Halogeometricum borinquense]ADQ65621.1 hypothetical protein Hbor_00080 [Halogeometricum borinquense DSM 11551]ELY27843.1 hypothetical protein C499_08367 [Halogeometricum borinquense DSM 11551]QIB72965.1 hypothetical protein G3I44_00895 [Halogeometricum borinquense]QIQ75074.1 hypothetical protein GL213_00040 [Halogeometricum borinquense]RYJ14961.1 hypothetical protein ELS19_14045 [Halogeometricum borinquense]
MTLPATPLQSGASGSALAVAGTFASLALFLSLTAHIAARNVLGDVPVKYAFVVGPIPAAIAVVVTTFELNSYLGVFVAIILDGVAVKYLYGQSNRLSGYITFIHVIVSIIIGTVLYALLALLSTAPV